MGTKIQHGFAFSVVLLLGILGLAIVFPTANALALDDADPPSLAASTTPTKAQQKAFKKASADFSLELFQRCVAAKGKNANVTIAPMSVMNALAVTANGADGKTAEQMRKVLGDGASMARINKNMRWYNGKLKSYSKAKLRNANAIWYHNNGSLKINKTFVSKAKKYYKAKVSGADFGSSATVNEINGWVARKTNDMIKRVISNLQPSDRIAIVNAQYFDAKWRVPFEADRTKTKVFKNAKGQKHKVKMMCCTERKYIKDTNVVGFVKPYAKGYSYVALLPKKGMSLKSYVKTLDGDTFRKLVSKTTDATVNVAMPRYSVTYANEGMEAQLKAMGIKSAFKRSADFSKMGTDSAGNLYIGSVIHKTKVDVDEEGTKAAAVTAIVMRASAMPNPDVKNVTLNRPFVYAIVDNSTKLPVFIGTVNDIKK